MNLVKPGRLAKGDTVGIISPSSPAAAWVPQRFERGIQTLEDMGYSVWTVDRFGRKTTGTVLEVRKSPVPSIHEVVHIVLQDGRQLYASPAHPTADGRTFGELRQGDILDNSVLTVVELVPYGQAYTYDLLPSGDTGFYWANNILVGSTLSPA